MKELKILGIHRNRKFSPNHIGNDDAIFSLTMDALKAKGHQLTICSEDEFLAADEYPYDLIFAMARHLPAVEKLQELERNGIVVVNSGTGIENCYRANLTNILVQNQVPYPKSFIVPTTYVEDAVFDALPGKGFWIKRGDFHAIHKEDVTFAYTKKEAKEILREYHLREIPDAVISEHLVGDLVKFYGVAGTEFFYWFYPYDVNHHKYTEYETINGESKYFAFDVAKLQATAHKAAEVLDVDIFGGDAIVGEDGNFHIIDLNDWPSFAPCRDEASPQIAARILERYYQSEYAK